MEEILQWLEEHKDALTWLFGGGVVTALLGGIYRLVKGAVEARRKRHLPASDTPFVIDQGKNTFRRPFVLESR